MPKIELEVSSAEAAQIRRATQQGVPVRVEIGQARRRNGEPSRAANFPLLMSHTITDEQAEEARRLYGEPLPLPQDLQRSWSQVDPTPENVQYGPHVAWALEVTRPGDAVLVHGEPGMQTALVAALRANGRVPVYATTRRDSEDIIQPDGSIRKVAIFKHVRYRPYPAVVPQ